MVQTLTVTVSVYRTVLVFLVVAHLLVQDHAEPEKLTLITAAAVILLARAVPQLHVLEQLLAIIIM